MQIKAETNSIFLAGGKSRASFLLGHNDSPFVVLAAVHHVADPPLELARVVARLTFGTHGDIDVCPAVVNLGDGANEVLTDIVSA
jgi:hypothetical protein